MVEKRETVFVCPRCHREAYAYDNQGNRYDSPSELDPYKPGGYSYWCPNCKTIRCVNEGVVISKKQT